MKDLNIRNVWESFENKHNASQTNKGRKVANNEFTNAIVKGLDEGKISWSDVSFKDLYENLVTAQELEENLHSSAFPTITGTLISKKVIDAYKGFVENQTVKIDSLVTTVPGIRDKEEYVAGWTSLGTLEEVKQSGEYNEIIPPDEKYKRIVKKKYGRLISLNEEDVKYDQTGQLLSRAKMIGERGAQYKMKLILEGIIDKNSIVYDKGELYPSGGGNSNYLSGADTALGTTGWEGVHTKLLEKEDDQGEPIWVFNGKPIMMVPPRLWSTAKKLRDNEYGDVGTANLDKNLAKGMFDFIVNPYYTDVTTTTKWHYGFPKAQFVWVEDMPLQTFTRTGQNTEDGFKRDMIMQMKVRLKGGIGATDTVYVYENAGA